jgi:ABC-2 type transport system permease protein
LITLALVAANLVVFNLVLGEIGPFRIDLTEDRQYSITEPTRRLLDSLDEDVTILGYFSGRTHPKLAPLVPHIRDMLEEYRAVSDGRVRVVMVDPTEDENAAQEASDRYGVRSAPFRLASKYETGIVNAWFALVVRFGDQYERYGFEDLIEIDILPDGDVDVRLGNLEYQLTRAIKKVVFGFRGTGDLFARIERPARLTAVVSPGTLPESFAEVPEALRTAAGELAEAGGDRFSFVEIDPSTDEATREEVARRFGARPLALGLFGGDAFWLYAFLEVGEDVESIPIVGESVTAAEIREDVEDALRRRTPGFLKTIGLVTPDPQIPPEVLMQLQMRGQAPPTPPEEFEQLRSLLARDYRVTDVDLGSGEGVPSDVDVLLVVKPTGFTEEQVFRVDQYLMRGGRVLICSGRFEADLGGRGLSLTPVSSGLDDWLAHHGIEIENTLVLDDANQALPIPEVRMTPLGAVRTWTLAPYPYLVEVREKGIVDREVAGNLSAVGLYWASPLSVNPPEGTQVRELLRSSGLSWTDDDPSAAAFIDYTVPDETEARLLGAALTGRFRSAWAAEDGAEKTGGERREVPLEGAVPLEESPETRMIVVGNAEFLSDMVARVLGTDEGGFFAENLAFIQNAIDWALLDNDLISIRSRAATVRRLPTLEDTTRASIEVSNYLVAAAALAALALWSVWRRRVAPLPGSTEDAERRDPR